MAVNTIFLFWFKAFQCVPHQSSDIIFLVVVVAVKAIASDKVIHTMHKTKPTFSTRIVRKVRKESD